MGSWNAEAICRLDRPCPKNCLIPTKPGEERADVPGSIPNSPSCVWSVIPLYPIYANLSPDIARSQFFRRTGILRDSTLRTRASRGIGNQGQWLVFLGWNRLYRRKIVISGRGGASSTGPALAHDAVRKPRCCHRLDAALSRCKATFLTRSKVC